MYNVFCWWLSNHTLIHSQHRPSPCQYPTYKTSDWDRNNECEHICVPQLSWMLSYPPDCPCQFSTAYMSSCWRSDEGGCTVVALPGRSAAAHTALCTDCWNWSGKCEVAPWTAMTCLEWQIIRIIILIYEQPSNNATKWLKINKNITLCVSETGDSLAVGVGPVRSICQIG